MNGEPLRKGCEVFVWGDKNVLELDREDGCSVFHLNTTDLHVFSEFHFDERNKPRNCSPTPCLAWGYDPGGRTQKAIDELLWHIRPGRVHDSRGAALCPGEVAAPAIGPRTTGLAASLRSLCAEPAASVDPGRSALRPAERGALSRASRCRGRSGPRPRGTVSLPCRPCRAWGPHRLTTIIKSNNSIHLTNNALQRHSHFRTDYKF